jgi:hypothetical protein
MIEQLSMNERSLKESTGRNMRLEAEGLNKTIEALSEIRVLYRRRTDYACGVQDCSGNSLVSRMARWFQFIFNILDKSNDAERA